MPRPNFFLAFPIDGQFVLGLPEVPRYIRRFRPDDVHMTLAFLGGCGEDGAQRALTALDAQLQSASRSPIAVSLGEVVPMGGSRRSYTALSALLETGRAEATACLAALRDPLTEAASGRRDERPISNHRGTSTRLSARRANRLKKCR